MHHLHAHRHHVVILRKHAEKRLGPKVEADTDQQRQPGGHGHTHPHAAAHAVVLAGAKVLPHKGGDGNAQRVNGHPEYEINFAVDAPGGDGVGAEAVHAALDDHVTEVVHGALGRRRDADGADGPQDARLHPHFVQRDMPGHALGADDAAQGEQGAGHLADHRGDGRTGHAPAQHRNEHHVQHDVDQRRGDEEVKRPLGITDGTQNIGAGVVQDLGYHAQKVDAQIQRGCVQNFVRRAHQAHHGLGRHKACQRKNRTDDHAEHQRRVYLAVDAVIIPRTETLRYHDTYAAAKPNEQAYQQVDERPRCAHRCQRPGAHKVAHDEGIGGVVQLLEQRAEPDRQEKGQQLPGDAAGQNIRLFDICHVFAPFFLSFLPFHISCHTILCYNVGNVKG